MNRCLIAVFVLLCGCSAAPDGTPDVAVPEWLLEPEIRAAYEEQQADPLSDGICSDGSSARLTQIHGRCPADQEYRPIEGAPDGLLEPQPQ